MTGGSRSHPRTKGPSRYSKVWCFFLRPRSSPRCAATLSEVPLDSSLPFIISQNSLKSIGCDGSSRAQGSFQAKGLRPKPGAEHLGALAFPMSASIFLTSGPLNRRQVLRVSFLCCCARFNRLQGSCKSSLARSSSRGYRNSWMTPGRRRRYCSSRYCLQSLLYIPVAASLGSSTQVVPLEGPSATASSSGVNVHIQRLGQSSEHVRRKGGRLLSAQYMGG